MLICVDFKKHRVDLGSAYAILDTDDYTVEVIDGMRLEDMIQNNVLSIDNIVRRPDPVLGGFCWFVEDRRLFDWGYTVLPCGIDINIGDELIDIWYAGKLYRLGFAKKKPISCANLNFSYWYYKEDEDDAVLLHFGFNVGRYIIDLSQNQRNIVTNLSPILNLKLKKIIKCSRVDFQKLLLLGK